MLIGSKLRYPRPTGSAYLDHREIHIGMPNSDLLILILI